MKITTSLENINSYGGLNFISQEFETLKIADILSKNIGSRKGLVTYQYEDVIKNIWMLCFAGGDCAEDIQTHLRSELENTLSMKVCSADTLLRVQKELATDTEIHISKKGIENQINTHDTFNKANMAMLSHLNTFEPNVYYDLDFDNQVLPCEKYDAKKSYKMCHGYFPSVATIGKHIVYLENRNGNSNVKFEQSKTLEKIFNLLSDNNVKIGRARMDCGSFGQEIIEMVALHAKKFYVRATKCQNLTQLIKEVKTWKEVEINNVKTEVCSLNYKPFGGQKTYRYVISREPNKTGQIDAFQGDNFNYRAIITNDIGWSEFEIIEYYNQRGGSEKIFDEMNNDFFWNKLPFSFINENTVFMMIMAMCRNFYLHLVKKIAGKVAFVEQSFRLKKFIYRFVIVPFKWIKKGGQKTLKLFTDKPYHLVLE